MTNTLQILIIEDDVDHAFLEETTLKESLSCEVLTVNKRSELRPEYIRNSDLILLDFNLPDATGSEILKQIRALTDVPVLLLSADRAQQTAVDTMKNGADDFLNKSPENMQRLPEIVLQNIKNYKQRKARSALTLAEARKNTKVETLRQVLTTLAHYINNSTTTISGYAQLCQQYPEEQARQKKLAQICLKETKKISLVLAELEEFVNTTEIKTTNYVDIPEAMFAIEENLLLKMKELE